MTYSQQLIIAGLLSRARPGELTPPLSPPWHRLLRMVPELCPRCRIIQLPENRTMWGCSKKIQQRTNRTCGVCFADNCALFHRSLTRFGGVTSQ
jgi:hypothetical protein